MLRGLEGRLEGDPRKIADVIAQLANSDDVPARLILGVDAEKRVQQAEAARAREAEKWRYLTGPALPLKLKDAADALLYLGPEASVLSPKETDDQLMADVDDKASQRKYKDFLKDYRLRSNSYESSEIHGQRALACIADFKEGNKAMVEYLVWVRNDRSIAEFYLRLPADRFDEVHKQVQPIIESLRLP